MAFHLGTEYYSDFAEGLVPYDINKPQKRHLNKFFRHFSVGYTAPPTGKPSWDFVKALDWSSQGALTPVRNQGKCSEFPLCFAYVTFFQVNMFMQNLALHLQHLLLLGVPFTS